MARIRTVKPEFWSDEKVAQLPRLARLTMLGLISAMADDEGRCKANPRVVRAGVYPLDDDVTAAEVADHLDAIEKAKLIVRYEVNGERYIQIVNWSRHQKIDRPTQSRLPAPPEPFAETSSSPRRIIAEPSRASGAERKGEEMERSGADEQPELPSNGNGAHASLPPAALRFLDFFYARPGTPPERRAHVELQLRDLLGKGVVFEGTRIRARDPAHLDAECGLVLGMGRSLRNPDRAIVVLLKKIRDNKDHETPKRAKEIVQADRATIQLEERYQRKLKAACDKWGETHPEESKRLQEQAIREFPERGEFAYQARQAWLNQQITKAAGFPSFAEWQQQQPKRPQLATV